MHGVRFEGCIFESNGTVQNGLKRSRAIYSLNASIKVTGYCSSNINPCPNLLDGEFRGFHTAIQLAGNGLSGSVIKNCNFDNNLQGITTNTSSNNVIIFNEFSVGGHPYSVNSPSEEFDKHTAIYSISSNPFTIEENTIFRDFNSSTSNTHGIIIQNSGGNSNEVYRNSFSQVNEATIAVDNNIDTKLHYGLKILCNQNTDNHQDIQVRSSNLNNLLNVGIDRNQDDGNNGQYPAGNTFSNSDTDPSNLVHLSFNSDYFYEYRYNANNANEIPLDPQEVGIVLGNGFIDTDPSQNANSCLTNYPLIKIEPEEHETGFTAGKTELSGLMYNYYSLIDNGNTDNMVNEILSTWPKDAWELRDEIISRSPYNSEIVLMEAATKNILPDNMLLEVLLANPDALQSGEVIKHVENKIANPLPEYMIDLLWLSRDEQTLRSGLEKSIRHKQHEMIKAQIKLTSIYLTDSELYNLDLALYWIEQNDNYEGKYQQAAAYASENSYSKAIATLDSIPLWFKLNSQNEIEIDETRNLYNLLANIYDDNRNESQMTIGEKAELSNISLLNAGKASTLADQLLCFFYDDCLTVPSVPKSNNVKLKPNKEELLKETYSKILAVYPNPGDEYITLEYDLLTGSNNQFIDIVNSSGRIIDTWNINGLKEGQILWDSRNVPTGIYLSQLWQDEKLVISKKVIIQH